MNDISPEPSMNEPAFAEGDRVMVLGATGFIGSRLVRDLSGRNIKMRLLVRDIARAASLAPAGKDTEVIKGDILDSGSLEKAFHGIHTAYYLVHSMGGRTIIHNTEFMERDKKAANNFIQAAEASGIRRVIYLGGLGEKSDHLSEHLRSRADVGEILSSSKKVAATLLRAAIIIGAGGASFEILRHLVERLPVMVCPRWIDTRIQPIAVRDVIAYLTGCLVHPETADHRFDICGPDIITYRGMMQQYAEARGLARRLIFSVPFLTPRLSAYWVDLITPVSSGVAHPLIEGLRNEVVCKDNRIRDIIPLRLTSFREAVRTAFKEERSGPGVTGF